MLCTSAFASVAINSTTFPNAAFRSYVSSNFDKNSDGVLSDAEIAKVRDISTASIGTVSLKGIENFTALRSLTCNFNLGSAGNHEFDYSAFASSYGLDCEIDDAYFLIIHMEVDGRDGLLTPMVRDVKAATASGYVLKLPLYNSQTLDGISFRTKGSLKTEVHVYP